MKSLMKRTMAAILVMVLAISPCWPDVQAAGVPPMQAAETEATAEQEAEDKSNEIGQKTDNESNVVEQEAEKQPNEAEPEIEETDQNAEAAMALPEEMEETAEHSVKPEKEELTEELTEITEQNAEATEQNAEEAPIINFVTAEHTYIEAPGTQNVVVDMGEEEIIIESAILQYKNQTTGDSLTMEANQILGGTMLFTLAYAAESAAGIYRLDGLTVTIGGQAFEVSFATAGIEVIYGVNKTIEVEPDDYLVDAETLKETFEEIEANVVTMDEEGNQVSETTFANVLEQAESGTVGYTGASGNLVVMLDPGHDATHAGAQGYGYGEESLVLKIAKYCKAELEQYSGVTVYMTRTGEACPNGGSAVSSGTCNERRVAYAKKVKASVYVSFHLNASASSSAKGVGVYYPNGSYNAAIGAQGSGLADKIYEKLHALGLATWAGGTLIRDSENGTTYPDGSLADYLGVIKNSKLAGITAVLIEHAFISNQSDVANFLNSNAKLKKLGVADATAIAQYYGLKKGVAAPSATTITEIKSKNSNQLSVTWNPISGTTGYQLYRSTTASGGYSKIATLTAATANAYVDKTVSAGKTYYYKVRAYKTANGSTAYAPYSKVVSGKTIKKTTMTKVQSQTSGTLLLEWKKISGATGYQIQRSTAKNGTYTKIATIKSGNTTSYTDTKRKANTTYYYKVRSYNKTNGITGYSTYSAVLDGKAVGKTSITGVQSSSGSKLAVTWKKVNGANGYLVYRSTTKNGKYKKIATVKSTATSYTDANINIEATYYYKVRTRNKVNGTTGYGSYSGAVYGKAVGATSITGIQSQAGGRLKITWKRVTGASGYTISRSTSKNGTYKTIATIKSGTKVTYTDKKLTTGKKYYYKVRSFNRVNKQKGYSSYSKVKYGIPMGKTTMDYVQSVSGGNLKISWKRVSGASGYQIQRSTSPKGKYTTVATINTGSKTTYTDKSVKTNKKYYYKIRATNKVSGTKGYGSYSKAVYGKAVAKTTINTIKAGSSQKATLAWKKVSGASGYVISRSTSKNGTYTKIATINGGSTVTYEDKNLKEGKTYYYKINVQNKINKKTGSSGYCSPVSVRLLSQVAKPSAKFTVEGKLQVNWNAISGADGYQVYRSTSKTGTYSKVGTISSGTGTKYVDGAVTVGKTYYYKVRAYYKTNTATSYGSFSMNVNRSAGYEIMGKSAVTVAKMVAYYNANATYPRFYQNSDAPDLATFCLIYLQECETEGVKAEVAFCQAMKETGFLRYLGDVDISQYNFAGLGATGNGVTGNSFASVRIGIRAQVQHLKAYASKDALKNDCVDDRFSYVSRGSAVFVEWLGIQENPSRRGWATDPGYGYSMRNSYIAKLLSY